MNGYDFNYFYGEQSEQFAFYRFPKALIMDARFKNLSNNAKILYGLMLDRMSLSRKCGWLDDCNRVYIKYSRNKIAEDLNIGKDTAGNLLKDLVEFGLIEMIQEPGKANIIFVKNFVTVKEVASEQEECDERQSHNSTIDKIIPYQPCFHPGNETCNYQCPCKARGFCEKYCACNKQLCKLSWNGCHCKGPCNSSLCPCFVNNRECDYDLCQSIINI